ncbi:MAG: hypothetical protein JWL98_312 [Xanthomonadaceae bacterium]|nr:hypothetical protein [Xanthomonadaceae bacterium]
MRNLLFLGLLGAMLGASSDPCLAATATHSASLSPASSVARLPDRGSFVSYTAGGSHQAGASTWHEVQLSEAHAINAIARGGMVIAAPNGSPIRLQFARRVVHPDGNWTWVGRPEGAGKGQEAILTFGPKAVFGSIPNGKGLPLEVATKGGRVWMVETDQSKLAASSDAASGNDMYSAPAHHSASSTQPASTAFAAAATPGGSKSFPAQVDLILGYTTGFATRWGGTSQANTRLNFIVDVANQAYTNSQVNGQVVLLRTVEVNYTDDTQNRATLYALSGVTCTLTTASGQHYLPDSGANCTSATRPAALQPLITARQQYGADVVSLVRNYTLPSNQTCGVAWLLGGGQGTLDASSADFALSVVSDSGGTLYPANGNTCRNETLAHELGHNMGLAHDSATAAGSDDSNTDGNLLDPEEYGVFSDSFGYKTGAGAGNFYDIMAQPNLGQASYRVFSNPRITICGGFACGVTGQADSARTLDLTMPVVASFRTLVAGPNPKTTP